MGQTGAQGKGLQLGQGGEGGAVLDLWGWTRVEMGLKCENICEGAGEMDGEGLVA